MWSGGKEGNKAGTHQFLLFVIILGIHLIELNCLFFFNSLLLSCLVSGMTWNGQCCVAFLAGRME